MILLDQEVLLFHLVLDHQELLCYLADHQDLGSPEVQDFQVIQGLLEDLATLCCPVGLVHLGILLVLSVPEVQDHQVNLMDQVSLSNHQGQEDQLLLFLHEHHLDLVCQWVLGIQVDHHDQ